MDGHGLAQLGSAEQPKLENEPLSAIDFSVSTEVVLGRGASLAFVAQDRHDDRHHQDVPFTPLS